ncbi:hypothetical protein [Gelidibacter japonicus]|uniref:hypothetical protein n=1 Tax=Gelidibacter japonicus TaxID=1962232 RepID=UPI003A94EB5E
MNKYIQLYEKSYETQRECAVSRIKQELINHKSKGFRFNKAINFLIKEFEEEDKSCVANEKHFSELNREFAGRGSTYEEEYEFLIIPNVMKPLFDSLSDKKITFSRYIQELAKRQAFTKVINLFRNDFLLYDMMYEHGQFDGYNNLEEFDIIKYPTNINQSAIFRELEQLVYPETRIEAPNKLEVDPKSNKPDDNNFFEIRKEYISVFESVNIYEHFTLGYLDFEKNQQEDFIKVFLKNPEDHNAKLAFECDTSQACYLLTRLNETCFKRLTQSAIGKSKKFISNNGHPFSQSTISRSLKIVSDTDKEAVDATIEFLKTATKVKKNT